MQKFITLLAAVGVVSAQSLAGLPSCATGCVGNSIPTSCNLDPECICSSTQFIEAISCCVSTACEPADQEATLEYARNICTPAGVTNLPTTAGCSASASGSGSASATSGSMTMTSGSAADSASSAVSSIMSSASEVSASLSSALETATSAASASAAAATEDAAGKLVAQVGVVGAGLLGVAAML